MPRFLSLSSLRVKFSLVAGLVLLIIFVAASFVLIRQSSDFERRSLVARARTFSVLATKPLGDAYSLYFNSGYLKFTEVFKDTLTLNETVPRAQIVSVTGEVVFDSNNIGNGNPLTPTKVTDKEVLDAVVGDEEVQLRDEDGNISEIIIPYSDDFGARPFSLRYFISYDAIYENIDRAIQTTVILIIVIFLTTLITITFLVNRSILSPLGKIVLIARQIREGNLEKKIELNTKDELNDLASSLNQMTDTLRANIEGLKQVDKLKDEFIMIASHNLRTPLTVIKGYIPFLQEKKLDEESKEIVEGLRVSTEKLEAITESLLDIVSIEGKRQALKKASEDIVIVVKETVNQVKEQADKKKITINLELPIQKIMLDIDKEKIKQALTSIVDNAVKFNKENGRVDIKLEAKEESVEISIIDTGVGISEEEQQKMFQKFHRGTDVLTYNYEGVGLGLYISKMIIESHQGRIWVESVLGQGTTVYISLPLKA